MLLLPQTVLISSIVGKIGFYDLASFFFSPLLFCFHFVSVYFYSTLNKSYPWIEFHFPMDTLNIFLLKG